MVLLKRFYGPGFPGRPEFRSLGLASTAVFRPKLSEKDQFFSLNPRSMVGFCREKNSENSDWDGKNFGHLVHQVCCNNELYYKGWHRWLVSQIQTRAKKFFSSVL
jgi:hypothetical protein